MRNGAEVVFLMEAGSVLFRKEQSFSSKSEILAGRGH